MGLWARILKVVYKAVMMVLLGDHRIYFGLEHVKSFLEVHP